MLIYDLHFQILFRMNASILFLCISMSLYYFVFEILLFNVYKKCKNFRVLMLYTKFNTKVIYLHNFVKESALTNCPWRGQFCQNWNVENIVRVFQKLISDKFKIYLQNSNEDIPHLFSEY